MRRNKNESPAAYHKRRTAANKTLKRYLAGRLVEDSRSDRLCPICKKPVKQHLVTRKPQSKLRYTCKENLL